MSKLSHIDDGNRPTMVDVSGKSVTHREARARCIVHLPDAIRAAVDGDEIQSKKGPVFATAIIAGVMAAKKTHELIPLCHPLPLSNIEVNLKFDPEQGSIEIESGVRCTGQTGVEMEALTAVSVAALTVYDMVKAIDKGARIEAIRLVEKRGGRSGDVALE